MPFPSCREEAVRLHACSMYFITSVLFIDIPHTYTFIGLWVSPIPLLITCHHLVASAPFLPCLLPHTLHCWVLHFRHAAAFPTHAHVTSSCHMAFTSLPPTPSACLSIVFLLLPFLHTLDLCCTILPAPSIGLFCHTPDKTFCACSFLFSITPGHGVPLVFLPYTMQHSTLSLLFPS